MAAPSVAAGQGDLPPGSGVDQYIETLPGAGGGKVPGVGPRGRRRSESLSPRTRGQLRESAEDRLLRRVANEPGLGAPEAEKRGKKRPGDVAASDAGSAQAAPQRQSLPAAASDTFLGSGAGLPVVLGLLAIALAGIVAAYRRGLSRGHTRS